MPMPVLYLVWTVDIYRYDGDADRRGSQGDAASVPWSPGQTTSPRDGARRSSPNKATCDLARSHRKGHVA